MKTILYAFIIIALFSCDTSPSETKKFSSPVDAGKAWDSLEAKQKASNAVSTEYKDSIAKIEKLRELEARKQNTVSAPDLTAAYEENEVNADNNFKGKTFYVTGIVTDIKKDILDDIYVKLESHEMFSGVQCFFDDKETAGQLQKGMKVTFKGTCDGLMFNVLMKDCVLVDNVEQ